MRRLLLFLTASAALLPLSIHAVTVNISVQTNPTCNLNGALVANASGGVGPYTYLWNTAGTNAQLSDVPAGTYSVTVTDYNNDTATDQIDLTTAPWNVERGYGNSEPYCGSGSAWPGPFFRMEGADGLDQGVAPFTLNGDGGLPITVGEPPFEMTYHYFFPAFGGGSEYTYTLSDANGCTGTYHGYLGYEAEWPVIVPLDVQGACAGVYNGSILLSVGLEGHHQQLTARLRKEGGPVIEETGTFFYGYSATTKAYTGLQPGTYWFVQKLCTVIGEYHYNINYDCGDSLQIIVPGLGNTCGNISGYTYIDYDLSCTKQSNEPAVPGTVMEIQPGPYYTITNSAGTYSTNLPLGSYTIAQQSATVVDHCNAQQAPFDLTALAGLATVNMGDTSLLPLDVMLSAANGPARPGFPFQVSLNMRNLTPAASGATSTVLTFDPTFTYVSSSPAGVVSGNTITWDQAQLTAFQERTIHVNLQVPPDINLLGMTFNNTVAITTANTDANTVNNSFLLPVTVTGAYDPNEKQAMTSSRYSTSSYFIDADNYIDYTIRFQNTGSDTAFNIVVTDTIAAELDLGTFIAGACSHPYSVDIRNGNALRFAFYNIQLPDTNMNEFASHGFVSFRMRPRMPLTAGTVIANTANIFFDFNDPVITAPSVLTAEFSTGVPLITSSGFELFPNPAQDQVTINASSVIRRVIITAMDGRTVMDIPAGNHLVNINISGLHSGPYVLASQLVTGEWLRKPFVIARTQTRP